MNNSYDALIIGAGAAGLMTAWQAGIRGRRVLILERSNKPGRKILMSGGGRCNFTNLHVSADNFICGNPHFVKSALSRYTPWDFIRAVDQNGIAWHERDHGQLFCDRKARDILDLLLDCCTTAGIELKTRCHIESVERQQNYRVHTNLGMFEAPSLVVATGGLSIPSMDPTPFGYELAAQFGLNVIPPRASLVPFVFTGALKACFARLSGNAVPVTVTANCRYFEEAMLFTHRGLSGPVILQISNYWDVGQSVTIDLLPGADAEHFLHAQKQRNPRKSMRLLLQTRLPRAVVLELEAMWWPQRAALPIAEWRQQDLSELAANLKSWRVTPSGTEGYRTAEVTLGGVDTRDLSSKTMASKTQMGLFFVGEAVDVTGHLGGFNFQWAWSSGYAAAQAL